VAKPALKLEPAYRSGLEKKIAAQFEAEGLEVAFEKLKLSYDVPARTARYTPDWAEGPIVIEAKGAFGYGPNRFSGGDPAKERAKLLLVKSQHPEIDLRIVFERASTKIYKGSPTTYAKWATDNNIPWADKGTVPQEWLDDIRRQQSKSSSKK
jgi:hypothetical protein